MNGGLPGSGSSFARGGPGPRGDVAAAMTLATVETSTVDVTTTTVSPSLRVASAPASAVVDAATVMTATTVKTFAPPPLTLPCPEPWMPLTGFVLFVPGRKPVYGPHYLMYQR